MFEIARSVILNSNTFTLDQIESIMLDIEYAQFKKHTDIKFCIKDKNVNIENVYNYFFNLGYRINTWNRIEGTYFLIDWSK